MEAIIQSNSTQQSAFAHSTHVEPKVNNEKILSNPQNYFGLMAMTMTIGSCWGGFVAMFVLMQDAHPVIFFFNVVAAMANNVAAIAQVPFKLMMRIFYGSIVINGLILAYLLLS